MDAGLHFWRSLGLGALSGFFGIVAKFGQAY
jgi:hypothetical protein